MAEGGDYGRREALFAAERPVISEEQQRQATREGRRRTRLRRWFSTLSTLTALGLFAGLIWYAYNWGTGEIEEAQLPIVRASAEPEKEAPAERGGLKVPYQNALVLNGSEGAAVERIVPPPEEPLPLTAPAPAESAPATAAEAPPAEAGEDAIGQMIQMAELDSVASDAPEAAEPGAQDALPEAKPEAVAEAQAAQTQVAEAQPSQTQTAQVGQVSGFKVQLASLQDPEGAQQEWKRLQGLHPELLGNLAMQTQKVEIEGRGTFYRIQAGPLPSRETADDLCALLKGRDQPCIVVAP